MMVGESAQRFSGLRALGGSGWAHPLPTPRATRTTIHIVSNPSLPRRHHANCMLTCALLTPFMVCVFGWLGGWVGGFRSD